MTEKELKNLRRTDLLEMLIESEKLRNESEQQHILKEQALQTQIDDLTTKLNSREILIQESGTLAEACVRLNGVIESAQDAADQYLENILRRHQNIEEECDQRISECQTTSMRILDETRERCMVLIERANDIARDIVNDAEKKRAATEEECEQIRLNAKQYADNYFNEKNGKFKQVLEAYGAMEQLFNGIDK